MSGLLDKAKDAMGKSSGSSSSGGQESSFEKKADGYANQAIDKGTDQAGMGDKYDSTIDKFADKQVDNQIPGGAGTSGGQQGGL